MPETETWRYRGQTIDREQVALLREFIRAHPHSSGWKLSRQLCETLGWKQANGALRDVVCRGLLPMLERAGEIELPPVRRLIRGQRRTARPRPEAVWIDTRAPRHLASRDRFIGRIGRTGRSKRYSDLRCIAAFTSYYGRVSEQKAMEL